MRNRNWLWLLIIILSLAAFFGYRAQAALREDSNPPEIQMESDTLTVSVEDPKSALLQGVTARDKEDGDVTDSLVVENIGLVDSNGTVLIRYAAFDDAGNVVRAERNAVYSDYISPRFTLARPLVYTQGANYDVLANVGAKDVIDGDIQHRVRATNLGEASLTSTGTHVVQFQVTNSLGDIRTENFPVEVIAYDDYTADLTLKEYLVYLPVGSAFNASSYLDTFSYLRENVPLNGIVPAGYDLEIQGTVQTQIPGVYSVSYVMTYTQMNATNTAIAMERTGYSKLIVVVEG